MRSIGRCAVVFCDPSCTVTARTHPLCSETCHDVQTSALGTASAVKQQLTLCRGAILVMQDAAGEGEGFASDSVRLSSTNSLDRAGTVSSMAETPLAAGAAGFADGRFDRTPGASPRAQSELQEAGGSLLRRSRNDLRAAR